jgi:hypothetical protein
MSVKSRLYIMTEQDLEIIDGLVNMLNLAITEVFASKATTQEPHTHYPIQAKFNETCYHILDCNSPIDIDEDQD